MIDMEIADNIIWQLKDFYPDTIFNLVSLSPMTIHHNCSAGLHNEDDTILFVVKTLTKDFPVMENMKINLRYNSSLR